MITAAQKKIIAGFLRIKEDELDTAITSPDEVELPIPEGLTALTPEDLTRVKNDEYTKGKNTGVEIAVKETKEALGLDFTGKTIDGLVKAAQTKAVTEAKVEPNEKVSSLERDLNTLRSTAEELKTKLQEKDTALEQASTDRELFKHSPAFAAGVNATQEDLVQLARTRGYDFKMQNGKLVTFKDGQPYKDNVANPVEAKTVLTEVATSLNWVAAGGNAGGGGRGAGDRSSAGTFTKLSELKAHYTSQGKNINGEEFMNEAQKMKTENPDFSMTE